jgi:hypothetical protein
MTRIDCERSSVSKRWAISRFKNKMGTLENTLKKTKISRFKTKMGTLKKAVKKTTFCNTLPMILIGYGNHRMA